MVYLHVISHMQVFFPMYEAVVETRWHQARDSCSFSIHAKPQVREREELTGHSWLLTVKPTRVSILVALTNQTSTDTVTSRLISDYTGAAGRAVLDEVGKYVRGVFVGIPALMVRQEIPFIISLRLGPGSVFT